MYSESACLLCFCICCICPVISWVSILPVLAFLPYCKCKGNGNRKSNNNYQKSYTSHSIMGSKVAICKGISRCSKKYYNQRTTCVDISGGDQGKVKDTCPSVSTRAYDEDEFDNTNYGFQYDKREPDKKNNNSHRNRTCVPHKKIIVTKEVKLSVETMTDDCKFDVGTGQSKVAVNYDRPNSNDDDDNETNGTHQYQTNELDSTNRKTLQDASTIKKRITFLRETLTFYDDDKPKGTDDSYEYNECQNNCGGINYIDGKNDNDDVDVCFCVKNVGGDGCIPPENDRYNPTRKELPENDRYNPTRKLPENDRYNPTRKELPENDRYNPSRKLPENDRYNPTRKELPENDRYNLTRKELPENDRYNPTRNDVISVPRYHYIRSNKNYQRFHAKRCWITK